MQPARQPLPIDELIPAILASLETNSSLIIEAPPGAGKTTRVPSTLLDSAAPASGEVWVLEPRRLAAWLAAKRVAEERGEALGRTVGYHVRFEEKCSPATRLRFVTDGLFNRWLLSDPHIKKTAIVVVDEVHERSLHADFALAHLRHLQRTSRPDLKIVAMSATADTARLSAYLGGVPILRSSGRLFPVQTEYHSTAARTPSGTLVNQALSMILQKKVAGDILVFLTGAAEIRQAAAACEETAAQEGMIITPLHADLPSSERDLAVTRHNKRKLILSTNVAESSITIPGVQVVIDSGLRRISSFSPWSGLPFSSIERISKASAAQRAGRAGRTAHGYCLRLYSQEDFARRPDFETPEISNADLSEMLLHLFALGVADCDRFEWYEMPPAENLRAACTLLEQLGAIRSDRTITETGLAMLRLPAHPRLARLIVETKKLGVTAAGCLAAALLGEREIRTGFKTDLSRQRQMRSSQPASQSDLIDLMELFAEAGSKTPAAIDPAAAWRVTRAADRLHSAAGGGKDLDYGEIEKISEPLGKALLCAFSDRVAKRTAAGRNDEVQLQLVGGRSARLARESSVRTSELLLALDAEQRRSTSGLGTLTIVRRASAIEPEWLLDMFPERIKEELSIKWNDSAGRVECSNLLLFDDLPFYQSTARNADSAAVQQVLFENAKKAGIDKLDREGAWKDLCARAEFVQRNFPALKVAEPETSHLEQALARLCAGKRSLEALEHAIGEGALIPAIAAMIGPEFQSALSLWAPETVQIPRRKRIKVHYEKGKQPWIESRLQDFLGLKATPVLGKGRVPLVLHLLAPNQRPVQVTDDLPGFWSRHYPALRQQLARRYPKHEWPDKP